MRKATVFGVKRTAHRVAPHKPAFMGRSTRCVAIDRKKTPQPRPSTRARSFPSAGSTATEDQRSELASKRSAPMTEITVIQPRASRPIPPEKRDTPAVQIRGRLRAAIEAMVWEGARRPDAAAAAGMKDHSLRAALKKPHVLAYLRAEMDVLRSSERPRNIHRLVEIRDKADNMPAVNAIRMLEQIDEEHQRLGTLAPQLPGLVVVVQAPAGAAVTAQHRTIDANPLIDNETNQSSSDDDPGNGRG